MIRRFTARFSVRDGCAECGEEIDEGDEAGYIDDEICCGNCCDEIDEEEIGDSLWFH